MGFGTRVGQAYVALSIDGDGVNKQITDSFADVDFTEFGDKHGEEYQKALQHHLDGFENDFAKAMRNIDRAIETDSNISDGISKKLSEAFDSGKLDTFIRRAGTEAGVDWGTGFDSTVKEHVLYSLEQAMQKAARRGTSVLHDFIRTINSDADELDILGPAFEDSVRRVKAGVAETERLRIASEKRVAAAQEKIAKKRIRSEADLEEAIKNTIATTDRLVDSAKRENRAREIGVRNTISSIVAVIKEQSKMRGVFEKFDRQLGGVFKRGEEGWRGQKDGIERGAGALVRFNRHLDSAAALTSKFSGKKSRAGIIHFFGSIVEGVSNSVIGLVKIPGLIQGAFSGEGAKLSQSLAPLAGNVVAIGVSVAILAAIMSPLAALISGVTAAIISLAGSLVFAAAAAGGVALVLGGVLVAAIGSAIAAYRSLDKVQKAVITKAFKPLTDGAKEFGNAVAKHMLPGIKKAGQLLAPLADGAGRFGAAVGKSFGAVSVYFAKATQSPGFTAFKNAFEHFLPDAIESLGKIAVNTLGGIGGLFRAAIPITSQFLGWLEKITKRFSEWANSKKGQSQLLDFFSRAADSAKAVGRFIKRVTVALAELFDQGKGQGDTMFDDMSDALQKFVKYLKANPDAVKGFFENGLDTARAIGRAAISIGETIDKLDTKESRESLQKILDVVDRVITAVGKLEPVFSALAKVGETFRAIYGPLFSWLVAGWGFVATAAGKVADVFHTVANFAHFIESKVGSAVNAVIGFFQRLPGQVIGFLKTIPERAGALFDRISGKVGNVVDKIKGFFQKLPEKVIGFLKTLPERASALFDKIAYKAGLVVGKIIAAFLKLPGKIIGFLASLPGRAGSLLEKIASKASSVVGKIIDGFQKLPGKVIGFFATVLARAGALLSRIATKASSIVGQIIAFFAKLPGKIAAALSDLATKVKGKFDEAKDKVKDIPGKIVGFFTGLGSKILGAIGSIDIGSLIKMPGGAIGSFASGVIDGLHGRATTTSPATSSSAATEGATTPPASGTGLVRDSPLGRVISGRLPAGQTLPVVRPLATDKPKSGDGKTKSFQDMLHQVNAAIKNGNTKGEGDDKKKKKWKNPFREYANSLIKDGPSVANQIRAAVKSSSMQARNALAAASNAADAATARDILVSASTSIRELGKSTRDVAQSAANEAATALATATNPKDAKKALLAVRATQKDLRNALRQQGVLQAVAKKVAAQKVSDPERVQRLLDDLPTQNATLADYAAARGKLTKKLELANEGLAAAISLRDEYKSSVADSVKSFGSLLTAQASAIDGITQALSSGDITSNLRDRLTKIKSFQSNLQILLASGLSDDVYKQLVDAGVENGSAYVDALVAGGKGAVTEVNDLTAQINAVADSLGTQSSNRLYQAGVDAAQGLVDGLESMSARLDSAAGRLGLSIANAIKKALGIKSPSRVLMGMMDYVGDGAALGLDAQANKVGRAAQRFSDNIAVSPEVAAYAAQQGQSPVSGNADMRPIDVTINTPTEDPRAVAMETINHLTGRL